MVSGEGDRQEKLPWPANQVEFASGRLQSSLDCQSGRKSHNGFKREMQLTNLCIKYLQSFPVQYPQVTNSQNLIQWLIEYHFHHICPFHHFYLCNKLLFKTVFVIPSVINI